MARVTEGTPGACGVRRSDGSIDWYSSGSEYVTRSGQIKVCSNGTWISKGPAVAVHAGDRLISKTKATKRNRRYRR